ncbi:MAG: hypothetical protein CL917_08480 [Deltaproteobacteria bacterium]|nr:hypothetical protein [Deltaproteobacteria bacterium]
MRRFNLRLRFFPACMVALGMAIAGGADVPAAAKQLDGGVRSAPARGGAPVEQADFSLAYEGGDSIDVIVSRIETYQEENRKVLSAQVETDLPARYELFAEQDDEGAIQVVLSDTEGFVHRIALGHSEFSYRYDEGETVHSAMWKQPKGDLLELADQYVADERAGDLGGPFSKAPLHRLALRTLTKIERQRGTGISVDRLVAATAMLKVWFQSETEEPMRTEWESLGLQRLTELERGEYYSSLVQEQEMRSALSKRVEVAPLDVGLAPNNRPDVVPGGGDPEACAIRVGREVRAQGRSLSSAALQDAVQKEVGKKCGCVVPRPGNASIAGASMSVMGATASIQLANVTVQALCTPDSSLAVDATGGNIQSLTTDPSNCPPGSDPWGGTEVIEVAFDYSGHAKVFPNKTCCHNGPTDSATSAKASIAFGGENASIQGPVGSGDWIRGESILEATGRVCYEDDLIFDDVLSIAVEGTSRAFGS